VAQGVEKVCTFVKHWRSTNSTAGTMARITLAWTQHISGSGYPLLEQPAIPIPYLETIWIASLRTFLYEAGISITLDEPSIYPPKGEYDRHVMDVFRESEKFDI
jgi:hypothetical protein